MPMNEVSFVDLVNLVKCFLLATTRFRPQVHSCEVWQFTQIG